MACPSLKAALPLFISFLDPSPSLIHPHTSFHPSTWHMLSWSDPLTNSGDPSCSKQVQTEGLPAAGFPRATEKPLGAAAAADPLHPGAGHGLVVHLPGLPGHRLLHMVGEWVSEASVGQDRDTLLCSQGVDREGKKRRDNKSSGSRGR